MSTMVELTSAYLYSVVRAVPNPKRGECVNLGVIVLAADGHFSDVRFGSVARVRKLDSNADVDSIRSFLAGVVGQLPMDGTQALLRRADQTITIDTLMTWSQEFGGSVRISEPRSVLASDPARLLDQLFIELVAVPGSEQQTVGAPRSRSETRAQVLMAFDRSVTTWKVDRLRAISGGSIRGRTAHHQVDRVLEVGPNRPLAIVEAINFASRDLRDVFGRRATICLAAEDLHDWTKTRHVAAFAVHGPTPIERLGALSESAELFRKKGVIPVPVSDIEPIRRALRVGLDLN